MSNYVVSHIRTFVPILVGTVVTLAANWGFDLELGPEAISAITGAVVAVYYAIVRALAERWPTVGILLGVNQAPSYNP